MANYDESQYIDPRLIFGEAAIIDVPCSTPATADGGDILQGQQLPDVPQPSELRPDAPSFVPSARPRLRLHTAVPTTPERHGPSSAISHTPSVVVTPAHDRARDAGISKSISRGRARSRSSPRGRSTSSASHHWHHPLQTPSPRLSRSAHPQDVADWLAEATYNIGDHEGFLHPNQHPRPALPPGLSRSGPTIPSTSSQSSGRHSCPHEDCSTSTKTWTTASEMRKHQRIHIPESERPHGCTKCTKRFWCPREVRRHMPVHDGKKFECVVCGQFLSRPDYLKEHMLNLHGMMPPATTSLGSLISEAESALSPSTPGTSFASEMRYLEIKTAPGTPLPDVQFNNLADFPPLPPAR